MKPGTKRKDAKWQGSPASVVCRPFGIGYEVLRALNGPRRCVNFSIHFEFGRAVRVNYEAFAPADGMKAVTKILGEYRLVKRKRKGKR
jgi:hypothetical protein